MSIHLAASSAPPWAWIVLALAAALLAGVALALMRTGSVAGPLRVPPLPGAWGQLALVTVVGFSAWVLIPGMFAAAMQASAPPATAPATGPAPVFTGPQSVVVSVAAGVGAGLALIAANVMFRPGGLRLLGLMPAAVPGGLTVGLLAALLILPSTYIVAVLTDKLWEAVGLRHPGAHDMLRILGETQTAKMRLLIYLSAIIVAPLFEELLFRGHLQTLLVGALGAARGVVARPSGQAPATHPADPQPAPQAPAPQAPAPLEYAAPAGARRLGAGPAVRWAAILVTSLLFTLVHGALWMMPPIFFLSVCLGYLYERTANLWAPIIVHLLFNLFNVLLFMNLAGARGG